MLESQHSVLFSQLSESGPVLPDLALAELHVLGRGVAMAGHVRWRLTMQRQW